MNTQEKLQQGKALVVVGLGYVGLPLALAFAKKVRTIGFDINEEKLNRYRQGIDPTQEAGDEAVQQTTLEFTSNPAAWNKRPLSLSPYRRRLRKMTCPI